MITDEPTPRAEYPPQLPKRKPVPAASPVASSSTKVTRSFTPYWVLAVTLLCTTIFSWRWTLSGLPLWLGLLCLGQFHGYRVFPWLPLWAMFASVNFVYAVASTSWLIYWMFVGTCYPAIILTSLFQFDAAAHFARCNCRKLLRQVHFIRDEISFFNLPALEIDTNSIGLFVMRGMTFSLSTLTATVYGVEVGVKLSDDIELAIQTDKVVIALFRRIEIGDVFANVKGADEMNFREIHDHPNERDMSKDEFVISESPILNAARKASHGGFTEPDDEARRTLNDQSPGEIAKKLSPDDERARKECEALIHHITHTSTSYIATEMLRKIAEAREVENVLETEKNLRAAVCAHMHTQPTIAHPPLHSIRLTTLRHNNHPKLKKFLHRFPLLYRLMLNPISYFHPVWVKSVTTAGSGQWFVSLMKDHFFKHYSNSDSEVRRLETRISAWLADANFAVGLEDVYCTAQFPVDTSFDIECKFTIKDLMAHRTLPEAVELTQVIHLGGADATITLPTYLFPHHEHIMPSQMTDFEEMQLEQEVEEAQGTPKALQLQNELDRRRRDEASFKISAHGHLPALFDQELLNFVAATVKATKVIETERGHEELVLKRAATNKLELEIRRADSVASDSIANESDDISTASGESDGVERLSMDSQRSDAPSQKSTSSSTTFSTRMGQTFKGMNNKVKDGWRKAGIQTVNVVANDRWIAKIVGNIMRKLEKAQGDVGYSGLIAIPLADWRQKAEYEPKILP